jgi:hypothetical protein
MDIEQFIDNYPLLYHMAEYNSWESIRTHGLLSTTALLDLFEITGPEREGIESCRRPYSVTIKHKKYGTATIRDQKPLSESKLKACLTGCVPEAWYKILNGKVFFWPTEERILNLLQARAYRSQKHTILIVDSKSLVCDHLCNVYLAPINTGAIVYKPTPRGPNTFVPFCNWPNAVKRGSGKLRNAVVEVAINYGIPNIENYVIHIAEGDNGELKK